MSGRLLSINELSQILFVSFLWGATNPLIRIGARSSDIDEKSKFLMLCFLVFANSRIYLYFAFDFVSSSGQSYVNCMIILAFYLAYFVLDFS